MAVWASRLPASRRMFSVGSAAPRAVVVAGMRTPFCKAYGELMHLNSIDLGTACVASLLQKADAHPSDLDHILWGNVVLDPTCPNVGREINLRLHLPGSIVSHQLSMQCLTGLKAVTDADLMIRGGHAECVVAGGSDSLSFSKVSLPTGLTQGLAMTVYGGAKTPQDKVRKFLKHAGPMRKWLPSLPSIAEPSTGKTMGVHADHMAEMWGITRKAQDEYAAHSHRKAAEARQRGVYDQEVVPVPGVKGSSIRYDNFLQDPNLEKMSQLKPAFRKTGTITAANATGLTDGGSAVLLASEAFARKKGWPTDIVIRAWHNSGVDPWPQLLIAPAVAIPRVLDKAGLTLGDIDIIELHEAFAAQVLATLAAINDQKFLDTFVGGHKPLGPIDTARLNVNGGSLAIGHPFAATGGRCVTAAMNELRRSRKRFALISICAAGGLGATAVLERLDEAPQPHIPSKPSSTGLSTPSTGPVSP